MTSKPILIIASLKEGTSEEVYKKLIEKYPKLEFSRIKQVSTGTWKIHYINPLPGISSNEEEIKRYCMNLVSK